MKFPKVNLSHFQLFFIVFTLSLFSCSKKSANTQASFVVNLSSLSSGLNGGIILYGINSDPDGEGNFQAELLEEPYTLEIPNGNYEFQMLGFTGPNPFEGDLKCGYLVADLEGEAKEIEIRLNSYECLSARFTEVLALHDISIPMSPLFSGEMESYLKNGLGNDLLDYQSQSTPALHFYGARVGDVINVYSDAICGTLLDSITVTATDLIISSFNPELSYAEIILPTFAEGSSSVFFFSGTSADGESHACSGTQSEPFARTYTYIPVPPELTGYTQPSLTLYKKIPISPAKESLPIVSGEVTSYSISPTLPAGLSFNSTDGSISGTPTALASSTAYTITASNSSGGSSTTLTLEVTEPEPMITVWKIGDASYGDGDLTLQLPLVSGYNYDFIVDWGDGNTDTITVFNDAAIDHAYGAAGDYTVTITGLVEAWGFDAEINTYSTDAFTKLYQVNQLGTLGFKSFHYGFPGTGLASFSPALTDTSAVTSFQGMFFNASTLTSLDLTSFDTSSATAMGAMFLSASGLTSVNLSSFNTSLVTDLSYMFKNASSLTTLDLTSFDTSSVTDMSYMFIYASGLTSVDLSSFNTSSVVDMSNMFNGASALTSLDLSNFNTSLVTDMENMFTSTSSLTNLNLSSFNTSSVVTMSGMFNAASSLTSLDLSNFNTSSVIHMSGMFKDNSSLSSLNISNFDTSSKKGARLDSIN